MLYFFRRSCDFSGRNSLLYLQYLIRRNIVRFLSLSSDVVERSSCFRKYSYLLDTGLQMMQKVYTSKSFLQECTVGCCCRWAKNILYYFILKQTLQKLVIVKPTIWKVFINQIFVCFITELIDLALSGLYRCQIPGKIVWQVNIWICSDAPLSLLNKEGQNEKIIV